MGSKHADRARVEERQMRVSLAWEQRRETPHVSQERIGLLLGVKRGAVSAYFTDPDGSAAKARKDGYRGVCAGCGARTNGSGGPGSASDRCAACAASAQHEDRWWTRERVVEALRRFHREQGRVPVAMECTLPAFRRWWPWMCHPGVAAREWGSWAAAVEAAGFGSRGVGVKVNPMWRGVTGRVAGYVVLKKREDGAWEERRVDSFSPASAIEAVADEPGTYVGLRDSVWVEEVVEPQTALRVVRGRDPCAGPV